MGTDRIAGFDLARAYAIFGMFIVNFQAIYGSLRDASPFGKFMSLFSGNSSSAFVILAGIGCSLLAGRPDASPEERARRRSIIVRRSWFLFAVGLALYTWWPADILHFYGGYMHLAALLLFVPSRWLVASAVACVVMFHALLLVIPYETGWNFETLHYSGFWTISGFLRNTFYNGWNPIFPWAGFFFVGMVLGRLDWKCPRTRWRVFLWALAVSLASEGLIELAERGHFSKGVAEYLTADYLPPFLIFMTSTAGFAVMLIAVCVTIGERAGSSLAVRCLTATGRHTLTHYLAHLTLGMLAFGWMFDRRYGDTFEGAAPAPSTTVFGFALGAFGVCVLFSVLWSRRFRNGPVESVMRACSR